MLCHVALIRTDVSEEPKASIIRVTRIGELGTLAITSNRHMLRRNTKYTLMMEALGSSETSVLTRAPDITSQKTPFFIVTTVKTSNLTSLTLFAVWQIWNHSNNTLGGGSLARIRHNQQLHYIIVHISVKDKNNKKIFTVKC
jgi:hypothetical protein